MSRITLVPERFTLVEYDAGEVLATIEEAAALAGFPTDVDVTVEVDEELFAPLVGSAADVVDGRGHVWISGANLEDVRRPRHFSAERSKLDFVVAFLRAKDRLDADLRAAFSLSLTEYEIMVRLSEQPGRQMRMAQLADAMCHSRSRITHTVQRMERAGLLLRVESPEDGRGVVARMTDEGFAVLDEASHVHVRGVRANLVDLVAAEDFSALGRVMNTVADHLVSRHPAAENPGRQEAEAPLGHEGRRGVGPEPEEHHVAEVGIAGEPGDDVQALRHRPEHEDARGHPHPVARRHPRQHEQRGHDQPGRQPRRRPRLRSIGHLTSAKNFLPTELNRVMNASSISGSA